MIKKLAANERDEGDASLNPGLGRSSGVGNCNPLQYSCQENLMDRGAWQATVLGGRRVRHDWACVHGGNCERQGNISLENVGNYFILMTCFDSLFSPKLLKIFSEQFQLTILIL